MGFAPSRFTGYPPYKLQPTAPKIRPSFLGMQNRRLFKPSGHQAFRNRRASRLFDILIAGVMATRVLQAQTAPWMDTSLRPAQRAALLASAMTLDEKIALVHGWPGPY